MVALNEIVLMEIFHRLETKDLNTCSRVCKQWNHTFMNESFWKRKLCKDFNLLLKTKLPPGAQSWQQEYKRVSSEIPNKLSKELEDHGHEVTHAAFSHDGKMFVTCGNDCQVFIYDSGNHQIIAALR